MELNGFVLCTLYSVYTLCVMCVPVFEDQSDQREAFNQMQTISSTQINALWLCKFVNL